MMAKDIVKGVELSDKCSLCSRGHSPDLAVHDHGLPGLPTGKWKIVFLVPQIPELAISRQNQSQKGCLITKYIENVCLLREVCAIYLFTGGRGAEGKGERTSQADSIPSVESDVALIPRLWDQDLSWNRVRCLTDWPTQVPGAIYLNSSGKWLFAHFIENANGSFLWNFNKQRNRM